MSQYNPNNNPFLQEQWLEESIKLDADFKSTKQQSWYRFQSKYHPKLSTVSSLHSRYSEFVTLFTSNLMVSTFVTIVILSTFGVSASEILSPMEYKPSTFFFKGYHPAPKDDSKDSSISSNSSVNKTKEDFNSTTSISSIVSLSSKNSSVSPSLSSLSSSTSSLTQSSTSSSTSSSVSKQTLRLIPADQSESSSSSGNFSSQVSLNLSLTPFNR